MKKALILTLLALAVCCAFFDAAAGTEICDDDTFLTYLAIRREEGASSFEMQTSVDYFADLRADDFRLLRRLALKAGAGDPSLRYTEKGKLLFSDIKWQTPRAFDCRTAQEVTAAMNICLQNGLDSFQLICEDEMLQFLIDEDGLYPCAAAAGIQSLSVQYNRNVGVIYAEDVVSLSLPWAHAADTNQFILAAEAFFKGGDSRFCIVFDPDFYEKLTQDPEAERMMYALSQMETWQSVTMPAFCRTEYSSVVFSDSPRLICESQPDIPEAIQQMGIIGAEEFRLILYPELFSEISGNDFAVLHRLEAEGGMTASDLRYSSERCILFYSGASIRANAKLLSTVSEAVACLEEAAGRGEKEITLFCSNDLYALLLRDTMYEAQKERDMSPIYDLIAGAGIYDYTFTHSAVTGIIQLEVRSYYAGTALLQAVLRGDEDALNARERETLDAARIMAASCADPDPMKTALNIHNSLCRSITYTIDDSTDEDDTAIGALMNGQANCDGYSDAFLLTGSLCGLEIRYQHGDTYERDTPSETQSEEATHMWNLLRLNGSWRAVDVTWDDSEDDTPRLTWFNIGQDRLELTHIRNAETALPLLPRTDPDTRPQGEYMVNSAREALTAIHTAFSLHLPAFSLVFTEPDAAADHEAVLEGVRQLAPGSFYWSWSERVQEMRISNIQY